MRGIDGFGLTAAQLRGIDNAVAYRVMGDRDKPKNGQPPGYGYWWDPDRGGDVRHQFKDVAAEGLAVRREINGLYGFGTGLRNHPQRPCRGMEVLERLQPQRRPA
jgi:hypothetical protein